MLVRTLLRACAAGFGRLRHGEVEDASCVSHCMDFVPRSQLFWWPSSYVHVFDISGLPNTAPVQVADIPLKTPMGGNESPCAYDYTQEGWLMHSLDGRYVYVGDSGDGIDTQTRQIVMNLNELAQTRKFIEID